VVYDNIKNSFVCFVTIGSEYNKVYKISVCVISNVNCGCHMFVCFRVLCVMLKQHFLTYWSYSTSNSDMLRTLTIIVILIH